MKFVFLPFSIASGLIAGQLSKKVFEAIWGIVGDEDPPQAKHREIAVSQLVLALLVEGAVVKVVRGLTDHGARQAWARSTGEWPGEERPEAA